MNSSSTQTVRPLQVTFATALLAASAAIKILDHLIRPHPYFSSLSKTIFSISGIAILPLFAIAFLNRKGWVRWVLLIPTAGGLLLLPTYYQQLSRFGAIYFCVQSLLQIGAIVLVFSKPSNEWFQQGKASGPLSAPKLAAKS